MLPLAECEVIEIGAGRRVPRRVFGDLRQFAEPETFEYLGIWIQLRITMHGKRWDANPCTRWNEGSVLKVEVLTCGSHQSDW